jgi:CDP-2,3-bis-(O-geranylgeranyl)-sn-glycerol synthase
MLSLFREVDMDIARAVFFCIPFVLAGCVHIIVIRRNLLATFSRLPIDFGLTLRSRRIFGENKTFRGALTMILSIMFWIWIQSVFVRSMSWARDLTGVDYDRINIIVWGFLLGTGCVLGELPNSFMKRQLDIRPGDQASAGMLRYLSWCFDQIDSLIGVLAAASLIWTPTLRVVFFLFCIALLVHPFGDYLMMRLGIKGQSATPV